MSLLEPPLPMLKLKRENVGEHNRSIFQNFLTDVLYDGAKCFKFGMDENKEFLNFIDVFTEIYDEVNFYFLKKKTRKELILTQY